MSKIKTKVLNANTQITKLNLSHTPDVMSKYMQIINDEAERILKIPICGRSTTDIRTSIACLTALNSMNKDLHTEVREMRKEVRELSTTQIQTLALEEHMFNDNLPESDELVDQPINSTNDSNDLLSEMPNNSTDLTTNSTAEQPADIGRPPTVLDQHSSNSLPYRAKDEPFDPFGRLTKIHTTANIPSPHSQPDYIGKSGSYPR